MKVAFAITLLFLAAAHAQSYGGQSFVYKSNLQPIGNGDVPGVSGLGQVRTQGDTLFFQLNINNVQQLTFFDLHLTPKPGVVEGGPLVLRLLDVSANPLSGTLTQQGTRNTANLLASPMLSQARAGIKALGINDNGLNNIGDIDRLLARGVIYSDIHSVPRPPPGGVVRGIYTTVAQGSGRRMLK